MQDHLKKLFILLLNTQLCFGSEYYRFMSSSSLDNRVCSSSMRAFKIQASSRTDCGQMCSKNADCQSIFFNTKSLICVGCLAIFTDTCGLPGSSGYVYYHRAVSKVNGEDCLSIKQSNPSATSGVYSVTVSSNRTISVYCDMDTDGGGWTVFQYRHDGSVDFDRTFEEFTDGFGDLNSEFWLGLQTIHEMAPPSISSEAYIYLHDGFSSSKVERASAFSVSSYPCFRVKLESGDSSFTYSNGAQFSTKDYGPRSSCSYQRQSGWWHHYCTWINPNGIYVTPGTSATSPSGWAGVVHVPWKGFHSMAVTKLMFRRN